MATVGRQADEGSGRVRAVVVGGGISGLTAAWELLAGGKVDDVLVLERSARVGGVLAGGELGGVPADLGAEALLARRPEAIGLAEEIGIGDRLVAPGTTSALVWSRGRLVRMPAGTVMGVPRTTGALRELLDDDELARAAEEPGRRALRVGDDVDVASWVAGRFGRAVVDRLVEPLLGGVYAGHASRLSLRATMPMLWPVAARGGSVLESFAPAGPAPSGPVFLGLPGGVNRLASLLADALRARGGRIEFGVTVRGIARTPRGFRLLTGPTSAVEQLDADLVVVAVPAPAAARLLAGVAPSGAAALAEVETASMALVTALVDADALPRDGAGEASSGVLVPPVEGLTIKASTFSSVKWPWMREHLPPGLELVRVSLGRAGEQHTLQRDDDDLVRLAMGELAAVIGAPGLVARQSRVDRWGGALPQYAVGHLDRVARIRTAVAAVPGFGLAGSVLDGVGVAACIGAARSAARQAVRTASPEALRTGPAPQAAGHGGQWSA